MVYVAGQRGYAHAHTPTHAHVYVASVEEGGMTLEDSSAARFIDTEPCSKCCKTHLRALEYIPVYVRVRTKESRAG